MIISYIIIRNIVSIIRLMFDDDDDDDDGERGGSKKKNFVERK
jgi:hypothetical protein